MKTKITTALLITLTGIFLITMGYRCSGTKKIADNSTVDTIYTNINGKGLSIEVTFQKGESHNHPLMAIWLEDKDGRYIETLYIAQSIGKGTFMHVTKSNGEWQAGPVRRPAALPYWGHKRGIKAEDGLYIPTPENPMPDAVTGPTPAGDFILYGKSSESTAREFKLLFEINQSWDWNEYWTNSKYPDDADYKTSSQPAIVYEAVINPDSEKKEYTMAPIGYSHYSGRDGSLTPDLGTLTTALNIAGSITVKVLP
jgi:hypothetical protein